MELRTTTLSIDTFLGMERRKGSHPRVDWELIANQVRILANHEETRVIVEFGDTRSLYTQAGERFQAEPTDEFGLLRYLNHEPESKFRTGPGGAGISIDPITGQIITNTRYNGHHC